MTPSLLVLTVFHTAISLIALISGVPVCWRYLKATNLKQGRSGPLMNVFLTTAVITSITGFLFPVSHVMPSHVIGVIALLVLGVTLLAHLRFGQLGIWRAIFRIGVVTSEYFLAFIGVAQLLQKLPPLKALAPDPGAPLFIFLQTVLLVLAVLVGYLAVRSDRQLSAV